MTALFLGVAGCMRGPAGQSVPGLKEGGERSVSAVSTVKLFAQDEDGLSRVFVGFKKRPGKAEEALIKAHGGRVSFTYSIVDAIAARLPAAAIEALQHNPNVLYVEQDIDAHALDAELDNSWGVKHIGAGDVHVNLNQTGTGVKVAILDSGVRPTHQDLAANVVWPGGQDFVNGDSDPTDDNGHGTHVAGSLAAADNDLGVVGVAPSARLYALKVLGASGSGSFSGVVAALDWCVQNGIQVTNSSLGSSSDPGVTVQAAYDNAAAAGLIHVAAAGNNGKPKGTGDTVNYPARYASVIAVGSVTSTNSRNTWSATGPDLELMAPGYSINSSSYTGDSAYEFKSGTSMAAPHVAGVAALMLGAGWPASEVRARMQSTATDHGTTGFDYLYGYGIVNATAAVTGAPAPPATPEPTAEPTPDPNATPTPEPTPPPPTPEPTAPPPSPDPTTSPEPEAALSVTVVTSKPVYANKELVTITTTVVSGGAPVEGADVSVAIRGPKSSLGGSGTTNANGVLVMTYTANRQRDGAGTYTVTSTASKTGYTTGSGQTTYQVQ